MRPEAKLVLVRDLNKIYDVLEEYDKAHVEPVAAEIAHRLGMKTRRVARLIKLLQEWWE